MLLILSGEKPIFEYKITGSQKLQAYFLVHSSLDVIDQMLEQRRDYYLGQLRTEQIPIFCHVSPTGLRILLMFPAKRDIDRKSEAAIREFMQAVNRALN